MTRKFHVHLLAFVMQASVKQLDRAIPGVLVAPDGQRFASSISEDHYDNDLLDPTQSNTLSPFGS